MLLNLSSSFTDSLLHPHESSRNQSILTDLSCHISKPGSVIFSSFNVINIILFAPLCIFILHHGLQQWRRKRSTSTAAAMSHTDCFTYHLMTMELIGIFGSVLCCCGIYSDKYKLLFIGLYIFSFKCFGELSFHVLTCLERYLAVVHPVTYLSLRNQRGIRIRNIILCFVWLLCLVGTFTIMMKDIFYILNFCLLVSTLMIISFCNFSVLNVLIRPGPGKQGGDRERVDQSKLRAFYTIAVILGVLLLRFACALVPAFLYVSGKSLNCVAIACDVWLNLPSSLVLILLFLHRAGKLVCWNSNTQ